MDQERHNYASYKLAQTSDIVGVAIALESGWVFRGHANASWPLSSSLEREGHRLGNCDLVAYEKAAIKHIKVAVSFEECRGLADKDNFSWLALLQHHGAKTRLVDFTQSFYVALYFAVRDCPEGDAAVWAIATSPMDSGIKHLCLVDDGDLSEDDAPQLLVNNSIGAPSAHSDNDRLAVVYGKPSYLNERLIAQQGLFLCPLNLNRTFMENLTKGLQLSGTKEPVERLACMDELRAATRYEKAIKICIPRSEHRNLLFHLRKMNITEATLFPGLDGFVRSLNYFAVGTD